MPGEWPAAACVHDALSEWRQACVTWLADADGDDGDDGIWRRAGQSPRRLPFGEHGDAVDLLNEAGRIGRALPPCPKRARPAQHNGVWLGPLPDPDWCPY